MFGPFTFNRIIRAILAGLLVLPSASPSAYASPPPADSPAQAAGTSLGRSMEAEIPTRPRAMTIPSEHMPESVFGCVRIFHYRGKDYPCDSIVRSDAEGLRSIIDGVPGAEHELDVYQANRRSVRNAAYFGTAGLGLALAGWITAQELGSSDRLSVRQSAITVRQWTLIPAIALLAGSLIYGLTVITTNENHLEKAVDLYNEAHPVGSPSAKDRIELQFSTSFSF